MQNDITTLNLELGNSISWGQVIMCVLELTRKTCGVTAELSQVRITKQDPTWLRQTMVSFRGIVDTCNILDIPMSMSRIQGVNLPHQLSRSGYEVDQPALTPEPGQSPSPAKTVTRSGRIVYRPRRFEDCVM